MANETTIKAKIEVSGLSELEKAKSLLESLSHLKSSGKNAGLSKMTAELNKVAETAKKAESALKGLSDFKINSSNFKLDDQIKKATEQIDKLEAKLKGISDVNVGNTTNKLSEGINKAQESANKLKTELESVSNVKAGNVGTSVSEGLNKANSAVTKVNENLNKARSLEQEVASSAQKVTQAERQTADAIQQANTGRRTAYQQSLRDMQAQQKNSHPTSVGSAPTKSDGVFKSSLKEAFGMYTLGQLGANAVMAGAEGFSNIIKSGFDQISTLQQSQVGWASNFRSVNSLLGNSTTNKQANAFSKRATNDIQGIAISAGNDYKQVSDAAMAFYSTGAGVSTAGNWKKTKQLTRDMLNLQDAGGMNEEEMSRFTASVAKSLDQDKVDGDRLNQLKQFNPNIDSYLEKAFKKRTGKDWQKGDKFTGNDLVNALHQAGTAPGVSDASKKMNQSLAGMTRAVRNGLKVISGKTLTGIGDQLNKAFGGDGKLFSKISGFFTSTKSLDNVAEKLSHAVAGVTTVVGSIGKEAWNIGKDIYTASKPYIESFSKGFTTTFKGLGTGLSETYKTLKGWGKNLADMIPKGAGDTFKQIGTALSESAGKATAFLVAIRGLSKLPVVGESIAKAIKPLSELAGKLPVIGKPLKGLIEKLTGIKSNPENVAATKMQSAANTMMSAANRMNGGAVGGKGGGLTGAGTSFVGDTNINSRTGGTFGGYKFDPVTGEFIPQITTAPTTSTTAKLPWYERMTVKGKELLGAEGSRVAAQRGFFQTLRGKAYTGIGAVGTKMFSSSKVGSAIYRGVSAAGTGIKAVGRTVGKYGAPGMNALFGAMDVMTALGSTKSGSLERHKKIGSAVGGAIGSTAGMALGGVATAGNPLGIAVGGMIGSWAGDKLGNWVGGKFGGSKTPTKQGPTWSQRQQTKAEAQYAKDNFLSSYGAMQKEKPNAGLGSGKDAYRTLNAAQKGNAKARTAAMHYADAMANGDTAGMLKYQQQMQKQVESQSAKNVQSTAKNAKTAQSKADKAYDKAYKKAYDANLRANLGNKMKPEDAKKLAKEQAKNEAKKDKSYQKAQKAADKAKSKATKAKKDYKKNTGKSYKGSGKKVSSANKSKEAAKKQKEAAKKLSQAAKKSTKSSKGASKKSSSGSNKKHKVTSSGAKKAKKDVDKLGKSTKKLKNKNVKAKVKTSGGNKAKKLSKDMKKIKNKKAKVKVKTSGSNKVKKLSKDMKKVKNKKAKVKAKVSGDGKVKKLSKNIKKVKNKNAKVKAKVSGEGKVKKLSSNIKKVKNKNATVKASTSGEGKTKSLASAIKKVKSKNASVKASVSGQSKAKSLSSAINQVQNKNVSVTATVTGTGKVKALKAAIDTVKDKPVSVTASVSGTGAVRSLAAAINAVHSKTVTITANVVKNGALATGTPGASKAFGALATGTPAATTTEWSSNGGTKKGVYLVNDAPGPDFVEAFKTKGGLIGLFPKQRNLLVPLPEGTQVLNAKETKKKFPRLEKGTQKFDMPKFPKLKLGTPGATRDFGRSGDVQNNVQNHTSNNNTFNITVNVNGGNAGTNLANNIANAIGEKLRQQFPVAEI